MKILMQCILFGWGLIAFDVFAVITPSALIGFEFSGAGEGRTATAAVENAVQDAEVTAAAHGYGDCQLKHYSYYPYQSRWIASARVLCTKDTSPPPPPPPGSYDPPTIFPPVRVENGHIVTWESDDFSRFALYQSINDGAWREIYKGSSLSWTAYGAGAAEYRYKVSGIASDAAVSSSITRIVISNAPSIPSFPSPSTTVGKDYTITWAISEGADQYVLEQKMPDNVWSTVYVGPNNTWRVSGLMPGSYSYRVRACANAACSEASPSRMFQIVSTDEILIYHILL